MPFGVNVLWDPMSTIALAAASGAAFAREIFTGVHASDMGIWAPDAGAAMRYRDRLGCREVAMLFNVSAEFASSLDRRPLADRARSVVFSSIPDAVLVSGAITGEAVPLSEMEKVKSALPDTAVLANTGVKHETVADVLEVADGCIVGSALKVDGDTWREVDPDRAADFMERGKVGPETPTMKRRLRSRFTERMLISCIGGHQEKVRRRIAAILDEIGVESRSDRLGNLISTFSGDPEALSVMIIAHMDQLGFIVRKICDDGLSRVEWLGGVPERAVASQAVTLCVAEGRDVAGVIANKSHHATLPDEKSVVVPVSDVLVDTGHASRAEAKAAGIRIGTPAVYRPACWSLPGNASQALRSTIARDVRCCWRLYVHLPAGAVARPCMLSLPSKRNSTSGAQQLPLGPWRRTLRFGSISCWRPTLWA